MKRLGKVRTWQRFAQPLPNQAHKRPQINFILQNKEKAVPTLASCTKAKKPTAMRSGLFFN